MRGRAARRDLAPPAGVRRAQILVGPVPPEEASAGRGWQGEAVLPVRGQAWPRGPGAQAELEQAASAAQRQGASLERQAVPASAAGRADGRDDPYRWGGQDVQPRRGAVCPETVSAEQGPEVQQAAPLRAAQRDGELLRGAEDAPPAADRAPGLRGAAALPAPLPETGAARQEPAGRDARTAGLARARGGGAALRDLHRGPGRRDRLRAAGAVPVPRTRRGLPDPVRLGAAPDPGVRRARHPVPVAGAGRRAASPRRIPARPGP